MSKLGSDILNQKEASFESLETKRILWDRSEELFHNQLADLASQKQNSQVFDPKLSTLTIERGYRVMSQLPVGKVRGISQNDMGDAKVKNLLLEKYVIPNANAQFDFLTKMRLVDIYSNVYGVFFALIDQDTKPNGYVGPDMWMLNIRDVFPQVGAISLEESDYVIVRTWKPLSYFKNLKKAEGFRNVDKIITMLEKKTGSKDGRDADNQSKREQDQYPTQTPAKGKGFFEVLTKFEKDRWVDICVDADNTDFRDQENPHENGELPLVAKYSMPLIDDIMGMSDFERGGTMQNMINAMWNMYGDAVKMSIFPPVIINKDNVAAPSSFKNLPSQHWLGRNSVDNVARTLQLSPQGISTFTNTYNVASASVLNLFGTTDTTVSQNTDSAYGKTPQALKMQAQRENTRDNADRFYMEQFVTQVMKKFVNLMCKKQNGAVQFRMFPDEIEQIAREYPEIRDSYDEGTGKLTVKSGKKDVLYDYEIVSGSTFAIDQKAQQDNLSQIFEVWMKMQRPDGGNMLEDKLQTEGYKLKFGEMFKRIVSSSGIQDWDKILEEMTTQERGELELEKAQQIFNQAMQGGGMGNIPPQPQMPQMPPQGMPPQMPEQQMPMQDINGQIG